jgi:hypothetical protein
MPLKTKLFNSYKWMPIEAETLSGRLMGFSGYPKNNANWIYSSFCWDTISGQLADPIFVRSAIESDSVAGVLRGGWMIDNVTIENYLAHPVIDYTRMDDYQKVVSTLIEDRATSSTASTMNERRCSWRSMISWAAWCASSATAQRRARVIT